MTRYPLMFTFRDVVSGNGFLAGVTLSGRALMMHEDGEWWIYGVRPGAVAEHGETPPEAYFRFKNTYRNALFDMASEASDYDQFRAAVERFFYEPDEEEERNWMEAVQAWRAGQAKPDDVFSELPKERAESRPSQVTVERLDATAGRRFTAADNVPDTYVITAAA